MESMKKITFLNGILDLSYASVMNVISDNTSRIYKDCILPVRKKAVGIEENQKAHNVLCRGAINKISNRYLSGQKEFLSLYLSIPLFDSISKEQKKKNHAHTQALENHRDVTNLSNS